MALLHTLPVRLNILFQTPTPASAVLISLCVCVEETERQTDRQLGRQTKRGMERERKNRDYCALLSCGENDISLALPFAAEGFNHEAQSHAGCREEWWEQRALMDMHGPGGLGLSSAAVATATDANARLIECCCEDNDFPPFSEDRKKGKKTMKKE